MEGTAPTPEIGFSTENCASCKVQGIELDQTPCSACKGKGRVLVVKPTTGARGAVALASQKVAAFGM